MAGKRARTKIIALMLEECKETMDTQTLMQQLSGETILTLRTQARARTIELGLPALMFDQAEAMVERDHVCLDADRRLSGWVYDAGSWRNVSLRYCAHCGSGGACVHQLAIMFADLLSRHAPQPEPHMATTSGEIASGDSGYIGPMPRARARSSGGGTRQAAGRGKQTCRDCTHCRWNVDGHCNNPNRRAGR